MAFALLFTATTTHAAITISNYRTKQINCSGGVCTPTAADANLNVGDLIAMLAASDVAVEANASAPDIRVADSLTWTSAHTLTLDAKKSISVNAPVVVEGTSGLTLREGTLTFGAYGHVAFWDLNSTLLINGTSFKLANSISMLAADIGANPSGSYALANSYDASVDGIYARPPVATSFNGSFEGLGNAISGLTISDPTKTENWSDGFFASTGTSAVLRDIVLKQEKAAGGVQDGSLGGLVGNNTGTIIQAHVTGLIRGAARTAWVGGVVGFNASGGKVLDSSFSGEVAGTVYVGGLVGASYQPASVGLISGSHASGRVTLYNPHNNLGSLQMVGGLVGENYGHATVASSSATSTVIANLGNSLAGGLVGGSNGIISDSYATGPVTQIGGEAGGLVGSNGGTVVQSHATGAVTSYDDTIAGGLAGDNHGVIQKSFATGQVSAGLVAFIGGLVGDDGSISSGEIDDSYATGNVTGKGRDYIGGLAGSMGGVINRSFATGDVVEGDSPNTGSYAGGLVGQSGADIRESFATGNVRAGAYARAGGLAGESVMGIGVAFTISDTYATGKVTAGDNSSVGGLIGRNDNNLLNSYSSGAVSVGANGKLGGLIGDSYLVNNTVSNCYWDTTTSGADHGTSEGDFDGITGLTDAQLKSGLPAGFSPAIWNEARHRNGGLPYLRAVPPHQGLSLK